MEKSVNLSEIIAYLKEYGFVFPHGTIYGGLTNTYDFGPLGAKFKNIIKNKWREFYIENMNEMHEMDSGILTHEKILKTSKHELYFEDSHGLIASSWKKYQLKENGKIEFNEKLKQELMIPFGTLFKIFLFQKSSSEVRKIYLRPETSQNIFINFSNVVRALKLKIPFGLAQIGKSFRKEFISKNFIMRSWEFEQMEAIYFFDKNKIEPTIKNFVFWNKKIEEFLTKILNLDQKNIRDVPVTKNLPHYSTKTTDWEYNFSSGWKEIVGLSYRDNFDLKNHSQASGKKLAVKNEKTIDIYPQVIESSFGVERIMMALISENLKKISEMGKERLVLKINPEFCYYFVAILPLTEKLSEPAKKLFEKLKKEKIGKLAFDKKKSIGQRYRYHDAIGTKYCLTYDFDVEKKQEITVRNRDNGQQTKVNLKKIIEFLRNGN